jgi:flagellar motor switch protein FliM
MPDPADKPEVLNQAEVDALLASLQEEEKTKTTGATKGPGGKAVQNFSFRSPSFLPPTTLRRLRIKHEEFASGLSSALSQLLRLETVVHLSNLETIPHKTLVETLSGPTQLSLFRIEPLPGMGILEISPRLGLTAVSRMLGGKAQAIQEERNFTELELGVLNEMAVLVLREYISSWQMPEKHMRSILVGQETSANYIRIGPESSTVFFLTLEAKLCDCVGLMRMGLLQTTLEPLVKKLVEDAEAELAVLGSSTPTSRAPSPHLNQMAGDILIPIRAQWNGLQMTLKELCDLKTDDIISLDPSILHHTAVYLNRLHKFSGQIGCRGNALAVRITEKIPD